MFKETDTQASLFSFSNYLPRQSYEKLQRTWPGVFAREVMPILMDVEQDFAQIYDATTGRPAWSVARKLGIMLLQHMFDLDDQSALDMLQFDIRWQFALGVSPEQASLTRRSYVQFRTDLVVFDPEMELVQELFERITDAAAEKLDVDVTAQRVDSTQITSNIQVRGRRWLFAETILGFVHQLADEQPECFAEIPELLRQWYQRRKEGVSWFGRDTKSGPDLETRAGWAAWLAQRFHDHTSISGWDSFQKLMRLVAEQCCIELEESTAPDTSSQSLSPAEAAEQVKLRDKPPNGGASMQTPHDPDAGYGHKGVGYAVHVAETCENPNSVELISAWMVLSANHNDWSKTKPLYARLDKADRVPEVMFADAGYPTPTSLIDARERGSKLHSPVSSKTLPDGHVGRDAFEYDADGRVTACPEGHAPTTHTIRKYHAYDEPVLHAVFKGRCEGCPLEGLCAARHSHGDTWVVALDARLQIRDAALTARKQDAWWDAYSVRSGVEATMSELKRTHGLGKLRVRGRRKVNLAVGFKMTACNIKRWAKQAANSDFYGLHSANYRDFGPPAVPRTISGSTRTDFSTGWPTRVNPMTGFPTPSPQAPMRLSAL
jgi:hypothetical protein